MSTCQLWRRSIRAARKKELGQPRIQLEVPPAELGDAAPIHRQAIAAASELVGGRQTRKKEGAAGWLQPP